MPAGLSSAGMFSERMDFGGRVRTGPCFHTGGTPVFAGFGETFGPAAFLVRGTSRECPRVESHETHQGTNLIKKLSVFALLLSLGLFSFGCQPGDTTDDSATPAPADPAPADPGMDDPGLADPGAADPGVPGEELPAEGP